MACFYPLKRAMVYLTKVIRIIVQSTKSMKSNSSSLLRMNSLNMFLSGRKGGPPYSSPYPEIECISKHSFAPFLIQPDV